MTNADSARPTGRVPDAPVVAVSILGDVVTVDGVVVAHDGTRPLHHVAVHAAAERVARPLGRAVRAVATDAEGRATMIVHPDGRASDVELVESFADAGADVAGGAAPVPSAPTAALPLVSRSPGTRAPLPPAAPPAPDVLPAQPAIRSAAPAHAAATPRRAGWTSSVVRAVAVAAALVAVVGTGVLLLTQGADDGPTTTVEPTPVAASGSVEPTPATDPSTSPPALPVEPAGPVLTVTPVAGTGALRLTLDLDTSSTTAAGSSGASSTAATGTPLVAKVSVLAAGATEPLRRKVSLEESSTEVTLGKGRLPGGTATWQVRVEGLPDQEGSVTILGPYVPPTPTPVPVPEVPPAPVAPVAPVAPPAPVTAPPPAAPPVAAPKPPPPPRATRRPEPEPDRRPPRQSKSKLKQ